MADNTETTAQQLTRLANEEISSDLTPLQRILEAQKLIAAHDDEEGNSDVLDMAYWQLEHARHTILASMNKQQLLLQLANRFWHEVVFPSEEDMETLFNCLINGNAERLEQFLDNPDLDKA